MNLETIIGVLLIIWLVRCLFKVIFKSALASTGTHNVKLQNGDIIAVHLRLKAEAAGWRYFGLLLIPYSGCSIEQNRQDLEAKITAAIHIWADYVESGKEAKASLESLKTALSRISSTEFMNIHDVIITITIESVAPVPEPVKPEPTGRDRIVAELHDYAQKLEGIDEWRDWNPEAAQRLASRVRIMENEITKDNNHGSISQHKSEKRAR